MDTYGILKCDIDSFRNIDEEDIISYKKINMTIIF